MSNLTTVTSKGQVTIPEDIRLLLEIKKGDKVSFEEVFPNQRQLKIKIISGKVAEGLYGSVKTKVEFRSRKYEREMTKKMISKLVESK